MEDQDLPILDEKTYVKETLLALWDSLPWVIAASLMLALVSLPALVLGIFGFLIPGILVGVLTSGPGWAAMTALVAKALLRTPGISLLDFFRSFGRYYKQGAILGGLLAFPLVTAIIDLPFLAEETVPVIVWAGLGADLAGLFFLTALYQYAFPQIVIYDSSARMALRNSFILAARYLVNTLGLIGLAALLVLIAAKVSWLLLVFLPGVWTVFLINNCRMVLRIELAE